MTRTSPLSNRCKHVTVSTVIFRKQTAKDQFLHDNAEHDQHVHSIGN